MTVVEAVGWALVHFLWQGGAIAAALFVALRAVPRSCATLRYALSAGALGVMLAMPIAMAWQLAATDLDDRTRPAPVRPQEPARRDLTRTEAQRAGDMTEPRVAPMPSDGVADTASVVSGVIPRFASIRARVQPALPLLVWIWFTGVLVLATRVMGGWWHTRKLRATGVRVASEAYEAVLARLAVAMGVRRAVSLLESARIDAPIVFGWLRPVILLPAAAVAGLQPSQIEAIVAHELAHVRRHDWLVNLAQTLVETVLFYHPAVWWVSRQMRIEREHCCDDLAVAVCGDPRRYVEALIDLEHLRTLSPNLALGMTSGSLVSRARRLLVRPANESHSSPAFGAAALALAAAVVVVAKATGAASPVEGPPARERLASATVIQSQSQQPVVIQAPMLDAPLSQRWRWATEQATARRAKQYWVGYLVEAPESFRHVFFMDQSTYVVSQSGGNFFGGKLFSNSRFDGLLFPGVSLAPAVASARARDVKLLFSFTPAGGSPRLARVHVSSPVVPVALDDHPVFWLGLADGAESLALVEQQYKAAPTMKLKESVIAAIGIHGAGQTVSLLERYLTSGEPTEVRSEAAEWLAWHPTSEALAALERAARSDRSIDVRREAAEAIGDMRYEPASKVLIELARSLDHPDVRREAVEALGERDEMEARDALAAIAREDRDVDIQREAVETLGDFEDGRGVAALTEIARQHPRVDVRREAVETLGDAMPAKDAIGLLSELARTDPHVDLQREAVETLGDIEDQQAVQALVQLVRVHPNTDVQREALETLADAAPDRATVDLLESIVRKGSAEVRDEALESLGGIDDAYARERLLDLARKHENPDVRAEAVEALVEALPPQQAAEHLREIMRKDPSPHVQETALESLSELPDGLGWDAVIETARTHPDETLRRKAMKLLVESDDPRARAIIERALKP